MVGNSRRDSTLGLTRASWMASLFLRNHRRSQHHTNHPRSRRHPQWRVQFYPPLFATFLFATDAVRPSGWITYLLMPVFIAGFAFLAIGWALMLASSAAACALYRITSR
jgi:hypothetical protein